MESIVFGIFGSTLEFLGIFQDVEEDRYVLEGLFCKFIWGNK
jgi:hypothetical protein